MTEKTDPSGKADFSHLQKLHFGGVVQDIRAGKFVAPEVLAGVIRSRGDVPVPEMVLEYACAQLAGEILPPKGRKQDDPIEARKLHMLVETEYTRLTELLGEGDLSPDDQRMYGAEDNPHGERRTPAERGARLVASLFLDGAGSWRTVQNIASRYRRSQE